MSNEEAKFKHSKRIHAKETHIKKQVGIAKSNGMDVKEPHKLAKHNAMDCGVPNCPMCSSPRKLYREETIQEKSHKQKEIHDVHQYNEKNTRFEV